MVPAENGLVKTLGRAAGAYPVTPLPDPLPKDGEAHFTVNTTVHAWSAVAVRGVLTVTGGWGASASAPCSLPAGVGACVVPALQASGVSLW